MHDEYAWPVAVTIMVIAAVVFISTAIQVDARYEAEKLEACAKARGTWVRANGTALCLVNKGILQ